MAAALGTDAFWLRTPDMQGPLNTAALIVKQDNRFADMLTEPDAVKALLDRVTAFLIVFARFLHRETGNRVCGNVRPYTFLPCDLGLALTGDIMPLLSAETYAAFGIPCLEALTRAFGGLHLHGCGAWGRHAPALRRSAAWVRAAEFHYPFTTIEELAYPADRTVFVPYIVLNKQSRYSSLTAYYEDLLRSTDTDTRFWFAFPDDGAEALDFARRHGC